MLGGFEKYPERPPSEAEWEDLLVRYEIAPRAVRIAVEDTPAAPLPDALRTLLAAEAWSAAVLGALREGRPLPGETGDDFADLPARAGADRFASLRAKNFASLQRRGIDVWGWGAEDDDGVRVTPYRLLNAAVALDGWTLAELRRGGG
ncbi:MAG TPA: hypothetical protein VFQ39_06945 [Longimicrobium sp.]|nr:hypothetical protein [Longimicrobium sp.]